jgi:uncharacterized protein (DUF2141 family)
MAGKRQMSSSWKWLVVVVYLPCVCVSQSAQVNTEHPSVNESASISGTVQDETGALQNARVSVFQVVTAEGWARLDRKCFVQTDNNGSYRCAGLSPGRYIVLASAEAQSEKNKSKEQESPYAFFPSTTDLEAAAEITARAGQLQSADIFIGNADLYTVSCRITSLPRNVNARLLARTEGTDGTLLADTGIRGRYDGKGKIRFEHVPNGSFEALVRWRTGREFHSSQADVTVQSADIADLSLEEQQPVSLEGRITIDSGSSVKLLSAVLERAFETDTVYGRSAMSTQVSGDGSFHFNSVAPGSYFLNVVSDPRVFVESSTIGGLGKEGSLLNIGNGSGNQTVQIDASPQVGSIGGVVDDLPEGNPKADVLVESEETGQVFPTTTDQSGKFMISGLGPGGYRVYIWQDFSGVAYRDPSVLHQYDAAAEVWLQNDAMNQSVTIDFTQSQ